MTRGGIEPGELKNIEQGMLNFEVRCCRTSGLVSAFSSITR